MNSKLNINARTNKLDNLIYFQDWEDYYNDILTLHIPRKTMILTRIQIQFQNMI